MKSKILILATFILGMTACDNYLDINTDPNSPSEENITSNMIFPGAEMNIAASYGDYLRIVGGYYAQQYAQDFGTSNYLDYSQFTMSATRSSTTYSQLYQRALKNLETVRKLSSESEDWGTYLAATTLRVFTFQVLVDAYGETPYTEAFDISNVSPKYDEGHDVYTGILAELDDALSRATGSSTVCTNFLFGTSTAQEWIQFANAVKLKILMRMSNVENVQAELTALIQEDNFPTSDVSWDDCWLDETGKASPYYQEEYATYFGSTQVNVVGNISYFETMLACNDTRINAFFEVNEDSSMYRGGVSGTNFSTSKTFKSSYFCRPVFTYDMPVNLITVTEIEFFKAEYYARYGTSAEAEAHYKTAIESSFLSVGLPLTDAIDIYTTYYPWNNSDYARLIGIQKWIALGGTNNFEAWCELRRLKYPAFGTITGSQIYDVANDNYYPSRYVPGTLYTPIDYNTEVGQGKILQRFKYAESSSSRNSNAPSNKPASTPIFWAQ